MADLGVDSRGQLLLIGALALGLTFVAFALIINSAIYTENLASRGDTTDGENVVEYRDSVRRGMGEVLTFENQNVSDGEGRSDIRDRLERGLRDLSQMLTRSWAKRGATTNVSAIGYTDGSRIFQNESRAFTNSTGNETWQLVSSVDQTRAFRLNISRANTSLEGACGGLFGGCFTIQVENGTATWQVSVAKNTADEVVVAVDDGTGAETCTPVDRSFVTLDLTSGTVAVEGCPPLSFADAPASGYAISYKNGNESAGTYTLVVDEPSVADSPPSHYTAGSEPSVTPAVYSAILSYDYQSASLYFDSRVRVAPGEADE